MSHTKHNKNDLTLNEHLRELHKRLLFVLISFIIFFVIIYKRCNTILQGLIEVGNNVGYKFVYISPQEILLQQLRISLTFAMLITLPILLYQVLAFIYPMFYKVKHFRIKVYVSTVTVLVLLLCGIFFAYIMVLPFMYQFLYKIGTPLGIESAISLANYINLFLTVSICMGIIFELPTICVILTRLGILTSADLKHFHRYMIVLSFVVGAIITPPDVISQVVVACPMILLYEVSILLCKLVGRRDKP